MRNFLSFANSVSSRNISVVAHIYWSEQSGALEISGLFKLFTKMIDIELSFVSFTCNFKYFFSAKNETHDEGLTQHNFKTSKKLRQFYEIAIHFVAE